MTSKSVNTAIKLGRKFTDFTRESWTTYLRSSLKDPRPVLQRISKSKAAVMAVAACPLPIAEDVVTAPIREPAVDSMTSTASAASPSFDAPKPPLPLVLPRAGGRYLLGGSVHAQAYDIGSVVCVRADTTPGALSGAGQPAAASAGPPGPSQPLPASQEPASQAGSRTPAAVRQWRAKAKRIQHARRQAAKMSAYW